MHSTGWKELDYRISAGIMAAAEEKQFSMVATCCRTRRAHLSVHWFQHAYVLFRKTSGSTLCTHLGTVRGMYIRAKRVHIKETRLCNDTATTYFMTPNTTLQKSSTRPKTSHHVHETYLEPSTTVDAAVPEPLNRLVEHVLAAVREELSLRAL